MKTIGVILSGSGHLDGAEIREAVLTLLALDKCQNKQGPLNIRCLAPNVEQSHVVNHLNGEKTGEKRNVLVESARIARGNIEDIAEANPDDFHGILMPGGFGAALNLSNFALHGSSGEIIPPVANFLKAFRKMPKPVGAICISPAVVGLLLGQEGPTLTIGNDRQTAAELEKLGAKHQECRAHEVVVDERLKIATSPAYMYDDAGLKDIAEGIEKCVAQVVSWA